MSILRKSQLLAIIELAKRFRRWLLNRSPARRVRQYRVSKAKRTNSNFVGIMPSINMKMLLSADAFFSGAYVSSSYEPHVEQFIKRVLKPGNTCIDIGANVGYYTLFFAKCVGTNGRVISFEPTPKSFAILNRNVKINQLTNVKTQKLAIFDKTGEIEFHEGPTGYDVFNSVGQITHPKVSHIPFSKTLVPCITFDKFREDSHIGKVDLIKVDVEGAEMFVIKGMEKTLDENPQAILILEFQNSTTAGLNYSCKDIGLWLAERGWKLSEIKKRGRVEPIDIKTTDIYEAKDTTPMVVAYKFPIPDVKRAFWELE